MEFVITSKQIVEFCGLVATLWGFWKIIKEIKKPSDDLKIKVERHERLLNNDDERLKEVEASNKMILQSLLVLINHDITGNGIDSLKKTRDELNEYLVNK